ncbi:hypothetical protein GQX74_002651 [Glossina fuscipes]|nr:hypothetical protein GQX74_002651 [Glossina fuscipes]
MHQIRFNHYHRGLWSLGVFSVSLCLKGPIEMPFVCFPSKTNWLVWSGLLLKITIAYTGWLPSENTTVPNVAKPLQRMTGYLLANSKANKRQFFCKFVDRDHVCTELSVSPDKQLCERYNAKLQFLTPYRRPCNQLF